MQNVPMDETLLEVLMRRDGLSRAAGQEMIDELRERMFAGEDPEELLYDECGLEPDYVWDLLGG